MLTDGQTDLQRRRRRRKSNSGEIKNEFVFLLLFLMFNITYFRYFALKSYRISKYVQYETKLASVALFILKWWPIFYSWSNLKSRQNRSFVS